MRSIIFALLAACNHDAATRPVLTPAEVEPRPNPVFTSSPTVGARIGIAVTAPGTFEIENATTAPFKLATRASVARGDGHGLGDDEDYRLVEDASQDPGTCFDLPAGAILRPVPWTMAKHAESGSFQLTVTSCDGKDTFKSLAFSIPSHWNPAQLARLGFAMDVDTATIAHLELPAAEFALGAPASTDHIAGFKVKGVEQALTQALINEFKGLVSNPFGFDDRIAKRCLMTDLVGVRLVRHPRTTGAQRTDVVEIAFDQTCSKLFAVRGDASHRVEMATHMDPQRLAFNAFAKRALP